MNAKNQVIKIFTLLVITGLVFSCKSKSAHQSPYDYKGDKIVFATGGGFSGKVMEYTLLSNGEFYKGTGSEGIVKQLVHKQNDRVDQIFKNYEALNFSEIEINESGNMYNYIVMYSGDKNPHKILWADHVEEVPDALKIYFKNLKAFARELNQVQTNKEPAVK